MDRVGKTVGGVLAALALAVAYRVAVVAFAQHQINQALTTLEQQQVALANRQAERLRQSTAAAAARQSAERARYRLADYTQLGSVGSPVRCTGRIADRPLR